MKKRIASLFLFLIFIISVLLIDSIGIIANADDVDFFSLDFGSFFSSVDNALIDEYHNADSSLNDYYDIEVSVTYNTNEVDTSYFEGYTFSNYIVIHYHMRYERDNNIFLFEAETTDDNEEYYLESLYGTPFKDENDHFDVVFYDESIDDYILLSELVERYCISFNIAIEAAIGYYFCLAILALAQMAVNTLIYNSNHTVSYSSTILDDSLVSEVYEGLKTAVVYRYESFVQTANIIYATVQIGISHLEKVLSQGFDNLESILDEAENIQVTSLDVLFNLVNVQQELVVTCITIAKIREYLELFLDVENLTSFYSSNRKVLCVGRDFGKNRNDVDLNQYQNYARDNNFWCFFNKDYSNLVKTKTQKAIFAKANQLLIIYCVKNNWDFVFVTNPYHYMSEHLDDNLTMYGNKYPYGGQSLF